MVEFSVKEPVVVSEGEAIVFNTPRSKNNNSKNRMWIVNMTYELVATPNPEVKSYSDVIPAQTWQEAYDIWREEHWREFFDPFKVKIKRLVIGAGG